MAGDPRFPSLHVLDHPLIQHKLSLMRDRHAPTILFRALLRETALLMGYEVTRELRLTRQRIETPLATFEAPVIAGEKVAIVAVLRAGIVMAEGLHELVPTAVSGHIGLFRDHVSKRPIEYFIKLPEPKGRLFIIVDPMLATGNSAIHAVDVLNRHGVQDANIRFLALVVAPEGMAAFVRAHAQVPVFAAALDDHLDENAYIVPGLGDAGDRLYGTH
jgi:uracil phosphoribosyltransferase